MISSGDIWLIDFEPVIGQEQSGIRPALVISGNAMNTHFSLSIVCPLTTSIKNMAGGVVLEPNNLNKLKKKSEILGLHIKSVSHKRFIKKIGKVGPEVNEQMISHINKLFKF